MTESTPVAASATAAPDPTLTWSSHTVACSGGVLGAAAVWYLTNRYQVPADVAEPLVGAVAVLVTTAMHFLHAKANQVLAPAPASGPPK
ncbi:MAG: hypothetical protein ACRDLF_14420 [Solirubrobacteraceae bacterium]